MISLEDLKDFDNWKKWKHGEVELDLTIEEKLTDEQKISFVINTELSMLKAMREGQKLSGDDQFKEAREKVKQYREELKLFRPEQKV